jgi:hypothetical protein
MKLRGDFDKIIDKTAATGNLAQEETPIQPSTWISKDDSFFELRTPKQWNNEPIKRRSRSSN